MEASILIDSFAEFARGKSIDRPTMIRILEDVFRTMIPKKFETDDNFDIVINADNGDLELGVMPARNGAHVTLSGSW